MTHDTRNRRAMIAGLGTAAAAALVLRPARLSAQTRSTFTPAHHAQDEWLDQIPGKHRTFIDSVSADGVVDALAYATNLFTANKNGYGLADADIAIIVCFRHLSTSFAFNNAMWAKYGKPLGDGAKYANPRGADAAWVNPHLPAAAGNGAARGIEGLAKRGVQFAICDLATHRLAGQIATATAGQANDIYAELVANAVPNGHFVAAGVVGATRAQEYGYSLLVAG